MTIGIQEHTERDIDDLRTAAPDHGPVVSPESDSVPTISVVMPTLNEEAGIAECITRIKNGLEEIGVRGEIIVADSSDDRTPEIAAAMGAVVVHPDEPGYGYAYRYAFEHARGEYVVIGDADTTYDFEELPKLFERVANGDADMSMGSRLGGEIKDGAMPALHRYVGNPLLTAFLNLFYDAGVSDAHSGFRVIRRDVLQELDLETDGMEFASEMIMEAGAQGLEIAEEPITYHEREGKATLDSFQDG
jgi:glycosyltransferase involved in cell wall biosynthesis